jgi:hypothetical protein
VERQKKMGSHRQSFTGSVSILCLELLETVFEGVERLSRRATGQRRTATSRTVDDRAGESQRAMKVGAK